MRAGHGPRRRFLPTGSAPTCRSTRQVIPAIAFHHLLVTFYFSVSLQQHASGPAQHTTFLEFCRTQLAAEFEKFDLTFACGRRVEQINQEAEAYRLALDEKLLTEEKKLKGGARSPPSSSPSITLVHLSLAL